MGKGANKQLLNNSGAAQGASTQLRNNANSTYNFLQPTLENDVKNPQGYTPAQLAYMNTASQQSLGGSVGGVTGQANLETARTRNAGGNQGAIASSARSAQRQLSTNALSIQQSQADLQQKQRAQALQALQQIYGVDEATALGYLNSSNSSLSDENNATGKNSLLGTLAGDTINAAGEFGAAYEKAHG